MNLKFDSGDDKLSDLVGYKISSIEVNPGKVLMPCKYQHLAQRILDLEVRPDDVWLVAYPRTGSTWTLEMLWCLTNNLDFHKALSTDITQRAPNPEMTILFMNQEDKLFTSAGPTHTDSVSQVEAMTSPRCLRSHLPLQLLPRQITTVKPKVVYVARNPKDVCVSYYHHLKLVLNMQNCSFEELAEIFLQEKAPLGSYLNHVLEFWKLREEPNVLFLKYEDINKNHREAVNKMSSFLGKELSEKEVDSLLDHTSFKKMQLNPSLNWEKFIHHRHGEDSEIKFIRKGVVGDWKNTMSDELSTRFDKWIEDKLKGTGLSFETI